MNPKKRWRFEFTEPERRIFRRRRPLKVSQWAEKYRILNRGPRKGPWSNALTPYLIKPMDVWNDPWVRKTNMRFAPQTGKTQCALNCLMYVCDYDPDAALYVMPDEKVAKRLTKRQIIPAFRSSPRIAELLSRRVDDTTTTHVVFRNGMELMLAWATSAAELASESIRYVFMDEPEKYPAMAGREGDPIYLAEVRTRAYPDTKKIMTFSSPNEEKGAIMRLESEADEFWQYKAVCPYCGHVQIMTFEQIVFPEDCRDPRVIKRKKLARYQCENCPMDWDDLTRNQAVRDGLESGDMGWHCEQPVNRPQAVAFHLPSWYSPFVSLSEVAADFLSMREKGPDKFKLFVTQHKAEPWKMVVEKSTETQVLKARTDLMPQLVPPEAVALVAGIDNQLRGKWFVVRAFARDFTSWLIHYGFLAGWQDVETLLFETRYPTEGNPDRRLPIWRAAIDTGGGKKYADASMTEEAYMWIRQNGIGRGCRVYAPKAPVTR